MRMTKKQADGIINKAMRRKFESPYMLTISNASGTKRQQQGYGTWEEMSELIKNFNPSVDPKIETNENLGKKIPVRG